MWFLWAIASRLRQGVPGAKRFRAWCARRICLDIASSVNIHPFVRLTPRLRMGEHAGIGQGAHFLGPGTVTLGAHLKMGPWCVFDTSQPETRDAYDRPAGDITVEEDVFIGARAIIGPGVRIGRGAAVGSNAVIYEDVPPGATVIGNPARVMKTRQV